VTAAGEPGALTAAIGRAYDATGGAWSAGPARVYDRLAEALVAAAPVPLAGRTVLDVGTGTGAAALAVTAAGGRVVAADLAPGMLRALRAPALGRVAADAAALPLAAASVGGVVAAFSLNHLPDPAAGFREAARVCRPGSPVLAAAYAADDDHPAKDAVRQAAAESGWEPPPWAAAVLAGPAAEMATPAGMAAVAAGPGLDGEAHHLVVELPDLTPADAVAWRMGMAQVAPFLAAAGEDLRRRVADRALALLGDDPPPVRRAIVVWAGVVRPRS